MDFGIRDDVQTHGNEKDSNYDTDHNDEYPQSVQRSEGVGDRSHDNSRFTKIEAMSSAFAPMEYKYRQLETSGSIRLLIIHPGATDESLVCELIHEDLANIREYEAISYVWGNANATHHLISDGQSMDITSSIHEALVRVRLPQHSRTVWADAICINQKDTAERGRQVTLMGSIYKKAKTVLIWLGNVPSEVASEAFELCATMSEGYESPKPSSPKWTSFLTLAGCEWFTRLWTVQEIVLARSATLLWGDQDIDWSKVENAIHNFRTQGKVIAATSRHQSPRTDMDRMMKLCTIKAENPRGLQFLSVLSSTRSLLCSDDRDRIYSVLGLNYKSTNDKNSTLVDRIVPDYTITVQELYRNVAELAVSLGFSAQLLDAVQHPKELSVWTVGCEPSWVPQWNRIISNYVARVSEVGFGPPTALNSNWHLQATSSLGNSNKSHCLATINDEGHLVIYGAHFDTIAYVSEGDLYIDASGINLGVVAAFWNSHVRPRLTVLDDSANVSFCKALTTTLTRGQVKTETSNWERKEFVQPQVFYYRSILLPLDKPQSANDTARERSILAHEMLSSLERTAELTPESQVKLEYAKGLAHAVLKGKRLFVTNEGRLGLGPAATCTGDKVIVFHKSRSEHILRPEAKYHRVIGSAFVEGLGMWFEDWCMSQDLQLFEIR
jgi:hypothetical protein